LTAAAARAAAPLTSTFSTPVLHFLVAGNILLVVGGRARQ
jgi:hypothetical protein